MDCRCKENEYCSPIEKICLESVCGNNICEPAGGENIDNCCDDCGCPMSIMVCNRETHRCEIPSSGITDEEKAEELVRGYLEEHGLFNYSITIGEATIYNGRPARSAYALPADSRNYYDALLLVVTKDGKVHLRGVPV